MIHLLCLPWSWNTSLSPHNSLTYSFTNVRQLMFFSTHKKGFDNTLTLRATCRQNVEDLLRSSHVTLMLQQLMIFCTHVEVEISSSSLENRSSTKTSMKISVVDISREHPLHVVTAKCIFKAKGNCSSAETVPRKRNVCLFLALIPWPRRFSGAPTKSHRHNDLCSSNAKSVLPFSWFNVRLAPMQLHLQHKHRRRGARHQWTTQSRRFFGAITRCCPSDVRPEWRGNCASVKLIGVKLRGVNKTPINVTCYGNECQTGRRNRRHNLQTSTPPV